MVAIIVFIIMLFYGIGKTCETIQSNQWNKENAYDPDTRTYPLEMDKGWGLVKDTVTGKSGRIIKSKYSGDRLIVNDFGDLIRNIDSYNRNIYYNKIKDKPGCTLKLWMKAGISPENYYNYDKFELDKIRKYEPLIWDEETRQSRIFAEGDIYIDKNGTKYTPRVIDIDHGTGKTFYHYEAIVMENTYTNMFERLADREEQMCKIGAERHNRSEIIAEMKRLNEQQKENIEIYHNFSKYDRLKGKDIEFFNKDVYRNIWGTYTSFYKVMYDLDLEKCY